MSGFEYNSVNFEDVAGVTLISADSEEYRTFLRSVYDSGDTPQYEQRIEDHPDVADEFRDVAERALDDPWEIYGEIHDEVILPESPVCGDCTHARDDEYRNGVTNIVCWENQPPNSGRKPRKLKTDSPFAQTCDDYWPTYAVIRMAGYDPRIVSPPFFEALVGDRSEEEQEKAALKYAYYQVWGVDGPVDTERHPFNPNREWAMLRALGSDSIDDGAGDLGKGGKAFEETVRQNVFSSGEFPDLDTVFRIETGVGEVTYKEMDLHTRVDETPIIAELFTQRLVSKKADQLADYERLYRMATGFEPRSFLVTDGVFTWKDVDGEFQRVQLDEGDHGEIAYTDFEAELREMAGLGDGSTSLADLGGGD